MKKTTKITLLIIVFSALIVGSIYYVLGRGLRSVETKEADSMASIGKIKVPLKYDEKYISKKLDGEIFLGDGRVGTIKNNEIEINKCENKIFDFIPDLDGYIYKANVSVNCDKNVGEMDAGDSYMIGILLSAKKYVDAIEVNDEHRKEALKIIDKCEGGDIACQVDSILKYFATKIKYIGDLRDGEHIEGVKKTLETSIADCEDISIVIASFLESLGIKTKFVLINGHAYVAACGLSVSDVKKRFVPNGGPFNYYPIDEDTACFALEGTLGKDAYIGFDAGKNAEKFFIDPVTKEFALVDSDGLYQNKEVKIMELVKNTPENITKSPYSDRPINSPLTMAGLIVGKVSPDNKNFLFTNYSCVENPFSDGEDAEMANIFCRSSLNIYNIKNNKINQLEKKDEIIENDAVGTWLSSDRLYVDHRIMNSGVRSTYQFDLNTMKIVDTKNEGIPSPSGEFSFFNDDNQFIIKDKNGKLINSFNNQTESEFGVRQPIYSSPVWSNDSKYISFSDFGDAGQMGFYVYDVINNEMSKIGKFSQNSFRSTANEWSSKNNYSIQGMFFEIFDIKNKTKYFDSSNLIANYENPYAINVKMDRKMSSNEKYVVNYLDFKSSEISERALAGEDFARSSVLYVSDLNNQRIGTPLSTKYVDDSSINDVSLYYEWSPVDNRIAYTKNKHIFIADINNETDQIKLVKYRITKDEGEYSYLKWSNDGKMLFFVKDDKTIYQATIN
jgi:hypothetical protein